MVLVVRNLPANAGDVKRCRFIPWVRKIPGGGHSNSLQYSCLENPHGQRSLAGYSPLDCKESDMTKATNACTVQTTKAMANCILWIGIPVQFLNSESPVLHWAFLSGDEPCGFMQLWQSPSFPFQASSPVTSRRISTKVKGLTMPNVELGLKTGGGPEIWKYSSIWAKSTPFIVQRLLHHKMMSWSFYLLLIFFPFETYLPLLFFLFPHLLSSVSNRYGLTPWPTSEAGTSSGVSEGQILQTHFHFPIAPREPDPHPGRERREPVAPEIRQEVQWLTLGRLQVRWRLDLCFSMQKAGNLLDSLGVSGRVYSWLWPPQRPVCAALMRSNLFADYPLASWFRQISICLMIYKALNCLLPSLQKKAIIGQLACNSHWICFFCLNLVYSSLTTKSKWLDSNQLLFPSKAGRMSKAEGEELRR